MANILLLGLDQANVEKIREIFNQSHHSVDTGPTLQGLDVARPPDVMFVSADETGYLEAVSRIRSRLNAPPVIVVTRESDSSGWLDALDAGASDYCSWPFDPAQLRWIVDAVLSPALNRNKAIAAAS